MSKYDVNKGNLDYAIRMGCEEGLYHFIHDYKKMMGIGSASAALRRLGLIGAYCEAEHGNQMMPATYGKLELPSLPKNLRTERDNEDLWGD